MGATLTTLASICKEIYEPQIREQLNNDAKALQRFLRSSDGISTEVGGKYVTFPIHTRRNSGIGARNENEQLPAAGQQGVTAARIGLRYLYGHVSLTGQTIELIDTNPAAFSSALDFEVNGLRNDLKKDQNRQIWSENGSVGVVGTAGTTVNTLTLRDASWVQLGMQIDLIDGTTMANASPTVKISNRQVTAINTATNVVTFDGAAASSAVGDVVVRTGSVKREWTGLTAIVRNSTVLYNVDPSTEPIWKAEVDANGGTNRAISEGLMILMADRINVNGGDTTAIYTSMGVRRAYFTLVSQQRQFTNTNTFTGGFGALKFVTDYGEIPMFTDADAPKNKMFFVNEKAVTVYREADWSWLDRDGNMWKQVAGYDAYEAYLHQYSELGTDRRNTHGVIEDITEA